MKLKGESQYLRESKPPSPDTSFGDPTEAASEALDNAAAKSALILG